MITELRGYLRDTRVFPYRFQSYPFWHTPEPRGGWGSPAGGQGMCQGVLDGCREVGPAPWPPWLGRGLRSLLM